MGGDRSDPRPMLAIFAVAVLVALWRLISSIRVDQLLASARLARAPRSRRRRYRLRAGYASLLRHPPHAAIAPCRRDRAGRRVRRRSPRPCFASPPSSPPAERSVAGWVDRRASAVRIRLASDAERRLVYLLEVPERSREALRTALRSYRGRRAERPAEEVLGRAGTTPGERAVTLRTELVLARPSVEPLARLAPSPIRCSPSPRRSAALRSERGETASVCVDLLPASGCRRSRACAADCAARPAASTASGASWASAARAARSAAADRPDPDEQVERRGVGAGGRREAARLRAAVRGADPAPLRGADAAAGEGGDVRPARRLRPLAERNWLRASGLPIPGVAFLGSDFPLRRRSFDRRFATGLFRPAAARRS